uniref:Ig-like domain-containing protein n=1 Tax=Seriola lalandi dorsalis TaxID=1841481 RepID=A0A3B4WPN9_SERLL
IILLINHFFILNYFMPEISGGTLTLTCSVEGSGDWKYDWFTRNPDSHETKMVTDGVQNSVSVSHEGIYRCRGRRGNPVFFTKHMPIKTYVTLTHNWTQIYSGEMITVRCEIQGGGDTDWEYEWRTTSSNAPPTHSEYRLSSASASYSGDYWCKARRDLYSSTEWSQAFTLTVSSHKPRPTVMADKRTLPVNGSVTLTCSVENSAEWKYDWFRRTSHSSEAQAIRAGEPGKVISISHGGIYHCRGGRRDTAFSTENSESVTIEKTVSNKAVVFLQPNWPLVFTGETITIRCGIHGGGSTEWEYEWSKPKSSTVSAYDEYRIDSASVSDSGNYRCKGKDKRDLFSSTEWSDVITLTIWTWDCLFLTFILFLIFYFIFLLSKINMYNRYHSVRGRWIDFDYYNSYSYELLPGSSSGTEQDSYIVHGQTHTAGYVCKAGRGDPVIYTETSKLKFVWSGGELVSLIKQMLCCHLSLSNFFCQQYIL